MRDTGKLQLPLTGHGLLYQVLANQAEKTEARAERELEGQRRQRRVSGPRDPGPRDLGQIAADSAAVPLTTATPPPAYLQGPSLAARELRAVIDARRRQREAASSSPVPPHVPSDGAQPS
ncbi:MAG TPA: hypothetical protein PLF63_04040 [Rubrivivax sp.]|nr:hypothetical protein [Rubrivivax sp.]